MLLADSVILVVAGLILIGIVGFFAAAVAMVVRFLGFVFRAIAGSPPTGSLLAPPTQKRHDACPHAGCGYVNRYGARYCARCGRALGAQQNVDAYG